ncbi:MAG: PIN domain-containing protein [Terracidiphilus sp.]
MKVALDTNILAHAEGVNGPDKKQSTLELLEKLPQDAVVVPVQVLGELYQVLVRKATRKPANARAAILSWRDTFAVAPTTTEALIAAVDLTVHHKLTIWDAVILAVAAEARCRLLLSEDMQSGFTWNGVTVVNPYSLPGNPLLLALLEG